MTEEQIQERFVALEKLMVDLHDKSKAGADNIEGLVDMFYKCHFLAESFTDDYTTYFKDGPPPNLELQILINNINNGLLCCMNHIVQGQERFGTTIITEIIHKYTRGTEDSKTFN